ncbi:MAG: SGNH/GDSL hydrolase family protein [Polyangiales bacterium]
MRLSLLSLAFVSFTFSVACSSSTDAPAAGGPSNDSGTIGATDTGSGGGGTTAFKTHVILGDSISDRGGQGPFFYDLLDQNDDTKYPDHAGKDFKTIYGADLVVQKTSKAGATSANLGGQIAALPSTLTGPVLVTITIGGNDVQAALPALLMGGDDTAKRADFAMYLEEAFSELTKPDRFGAGVQVKVLVANVYDPSDGTGNFKFASGTKCPGALQFWPASKPTAPLLDNWEKVMTDTAAKHPGITVLDLRAKFNGHGVPAGETWFYSDCIHPNSPGHNEIRDLFFDAAKQL